MAEVGTMRGMPVREEARARSASRLSLVRTRLREAMGATGVTVHVLSERAGVSDACLWGLLAGERLPSAQTIVGLSEALGISCDWLLGFDSVPVRSDHDRE